MATSSSQTQPHHISSHPMTSHHLTSQPTYHITPPHHQPHLATNQMTSYHITSQHITSPPPTHGWRLVCTKNSVRASHWLVDLRSFFRQILSLGSKFRSPRLAITSIRKSLISSFSGFKSQRKRMKWELLWTNLVVKVTSPPEIWLQPSEVRIWS